MRFPTESQDPQSTSASNGLAKKKKRKKSASSKERLQGQLFVLPLALNGDEKDSPENSTSLGLNLHNSLGLRSQQKELGVHRC